MKLIPTWFSDMPMSVKSSLVVLTLLYIYGLLSIPFIVIPLTIILLFVGCAIRLFIYLAHGE